MQSSCHVPLQGHRGGGTSFLSTATDRSPYQTRAHPMISQTLRHGGPNAPTLSIRSRLPLPPRPAAVAADVHSYGCVCCTHFRISLSRPCRTPRWSKVKRGIHVTNQTQPWPLPRIHIRAESESWVRCCSQIGIPRCNRRQSDGGGKGVRGTREEGGAKCVRRSERSKVGTLEQTHRRRRRTMSTTIHVQYYNEGFSVLSSSPSAGIYTHIHK